MKKRKEKKAEIGSESIIIWIVVIAVVILAIIFVSRMDINTLIKNLPGFSGPEDEDKEIEGIDESMFFDCKYPIGRVSIGVERRDIWLLDLYNTKEIPFSELKEQLEKAKLAPLLKMEVSGKDYDILYIEKDFLLSFWDSKTNPGSANPQYDEEGIMIPWRRIEFKEEFKDFIFEEDNYDLPGIKKSIGQNHLDQLKKDLRILDNAKYHPSTGLLCRDSMVLGSASSGVAKQKIFVSNPLGIESKIGINLDERNFDGKAHIFDDGGMSRYYFESDEEFVYETTINLYVDEELACLIPVGMAIPILECEIFEFGIDSSIEYFVLGGQGQFMFFESLESYEAAKNTNS